jgi:hypothetical protein
MQSSPLPGTGNPDVKALVYITAMAPDEGETVGELLHRAASHASAPALIPDEDGFIWMSLQGFADAVAHESSRDAAQRASITHGLSPSVGGRPSNPVLASTRLTRVGRCFEILGCEASALSRRRPGHRAHIGSIDSIDYLVDHGHRVWKGSICSKMSFASSRRSCHLGSVAIYLIALGFTRWVSSP